MLQELNEVHADAGDSGAAIAQFSRELLAAGNITDQTSSAAEKLAQTIRSNLDRSLAEGNRRLEQAKQKFEQYRDAIAGGIRSGNTLSDAARNQEEALRRVEDAQKDYNDALKSGDKQEIAKTAAALASAKKEQRGFLGFLGLGVQTAEGFAGQIDALRLAGASMEVVQQIAELGAETGGRIAAELLAGGAAAIAQANQMVKAVEDASIRAGVAAAKQFHSAGIRAAKEFIAAIEATIPELQSVLDRIADMIQAALGVRPNVNISGDASNVQSGSTGTVVVDGTKSGSTKTSPEPSGPGKILVPGTFLAAGGLVTGPTFGVVGEAGPELVIPLDRLGDMGGGTNIVVNVTGALDPEGVARQIERILRDSRRRTGGVLV
jgi:hypothetical protein